MHKWLREDQLNWGELLDTAVQAANRFLEDLPTRPAAISPPSQQYEGLPEDGLGALAALAQFQTRFGDHLSGSAGPRYFGFVTGGATPAALIGDWLTSVYDQNVVSYDDSIASLVEQETIHLLKQLFGLPETFIGTFVSGATVSNLVGLAQGRQWAAQQLGVDVANDGLYSHEPIPIIAATPHASIYKSLAILGMGKKKMTILPTLPRREAMDVNALAQYLSEMGDTPTIVIASSGTVNVVDYDDLLAIAALKEKHQFWLHVDAAFGGFAACSPRFRHLIAGMDSADSITIDAHKWLNVPYDSAMTFSRHPNLQVAVFQNSAVYLGSTHDKPGPVHWTPQNSRRFRAFSAWMTLMAYGRSGYQEIVERNCEQARWLGEQIDLSTQFRLLAPVNMNVVCFTVSKDSITLDEIHHYLARLRDDGRLFLTPTEYKGVPAIRAAISNWQTEKKDMEICWQALRDCLQP